MARQGRQLAHLEEGRLLGLLLALLLLRRAPRVRVAKHGELGLRHG